MEIEKKFCPVCQENNQKSRIDIIGLSKTCLGTYAYYDEEGNYIKKDPNTTTIYYKCSNGHTWTEKSNNYV